MSSREKILKAVRAGKPAELPMPPPFTPIREAGGVTSRFITVLTGIGGVCRTVGNLGEVLPLLRATLAPGAVVVSNIEELEGYNMDAYRNKSAAELHAVDTVILRGTLGVAENGAVWLTERSLGNRMLPFICQHLVMVLDEIDIVPTLHDAYDKIKIQEEGYGVFIAGPSKTADIEQSLVIGAHGPLSLQVFLVSGL